jgi:predicted peptidase
MKARFLLQFFFVLLFLTGCTLMQKKENKPEPITGQHPQFFQTTGNPAVEGQYLFYLPENYGQRNELWPLILFLHGAGERGSDLELVKKHGIPKIAEEQMDFPFIVVSPQCPVGSRWTQEHVMLKALLDEIIADYNVDTSRIYLTGLSMGGFGTWSFASENPTIFAAIAPVCGGGDISMADNLINIPIWAFHGAKDTVVPLERSVEMVNAVNNLGGDARLTVYPDADHDSWTQTYDNLQLYKWLLSHKKKK